jgi:glyoxylase-like metal-dependent hydrolase (beta-lactamase superfamily II)
MRKLQLLVVVLALFPVAAFSQPAGWNDPFPAHHVMDNVYFVGTKELASFLITTPQGHILIDRIVDDGDTVTLGGTTLTAHLLPGHTKGCLAWSMDLKEDGKTYHALVECSLNGQFLQYVGNKDYPGIAEDMRATYKKARELSVDVFLSSHSSFYGLAQKYPKLAGRRAGDPNPFVDPKGYQTHVDEFEKTFEAALARQLAGAQGKGEQK